LPFYFGKTQSPIGKKPLPFYFGKTHSVVGKKPSPFYFGKTHSCVGKKPSCLHRGSRYLVVSRCRCLGKTQFCYWEKTFSVSIGVVAIGVFVSIGCLSLIVGVVAMSHFCFLQLILLYITKYVHQYYLLHYSTYVLYITAALSLELL